MGVRVNFSLYNNYKPHQNQYRQSFSAKKFQLKDVEKQDNNIGSYSIASILPIKKSQEINKAKKQLREIYDDLYCDMADEASQLGVNFIQPKLEFAPLAKNMYAWYLTGENKIVVNENKLSSKTNARFNDGRCIVIELKNGKEIPCVDFVMPLFKKPSGNCVYVEGDEKIFSLGGTLKHELTHALQEQIMLSADGPLEAMYEMLKAKNPKSYKKISFEDFKNQIPFYASYPKSDKIELHKKIDLIYDGLENSDGSTVQISYSPYDIIEHKVNYDFDDCDKYYTDIMEIEARLQQAEFFADYKKYMPNIDIDPEVQNYYYNCMVYICQTLLEP